MAAYDYLQSPLFLERLAAWRQTQDEGTRDLLITEHINPLYEYMGATKALWLSREDREDASANATRRAWKSLAAYDPNIAQPFKWFARIWYNEMKRTTKKVMARRDHEAYSMDDSGFDGGDESANLDRVTSRAPKMFDENQQVYYDLINISPLHAHVLKAMLAGHGVHGMAPLRCNELARETGVAPEIVAAVIREVRGFLTPGTTAPVSSLINDMQLLEAWQSNSGTAPGERIANA